MSKLMTVAVAPTEDKSALEYLFAHLGEFIERKSEILTDPEKYFFPLRGTGLSELFIGNTELCLGDLLCLWTKHTPWTRVGPEGVCHIYHLGGSPLSGDIFSCKAWDMLTGGFCRLDLPDRMSAFRYPAREVIAKRTPVSEAQRKLMAGASTRFSRIGDCLAS